MTLKVFRYKVKRSSIYGTWEYTVTDINQDEHFLEEWGEYLDDRYGWSEYYRGYIIERVFDPTIILKVLTKEWDRKTCQMNRLFRERADLHRDIRDIKIPLNEDEIEYQEAMLEG